MACTNASHWPLHFVYTLNHSILEISTAAPSRQCVHSVRTRRLCARLVNLSHYQWLRRRHHCLPSPQPANQLVGNSANPSSRVWPASGSSLRRLKLSPHFGSRRVSNSSAFCSLQACPANEVSGGTAGVMFGYPRLRFTLRRRWLTMRGRTALCGTIVLFVPHRLRSLHLHHFTRLHDLSITAPHRYYLLPCRLLETPVRRSSLLRLLNFQQSKEPHTLS